MTLVRLQGGAQADRELLGGKAWSIDRMLSMGIPVPPAFAIGTDACARYYGNDRALPGDVTDALPAALAWLEQSAGRELGGGERPLLVSVRSGAAQSMPGMMDTILNLGINDAVERALGQLTGDPAFAADTRRRFEESYRAIVGAGPPADPREQLLGAIAAVFDSWRSRRAVAYRAERGIPDSGGTAVTVQAMVFGNLDDRSGTGVLFTRNPLTGAPGAYGEWLARGQGEDVVSGRHDPLALDALAQAQPEVHAELIEAATRLERDARDAVDIEFTVEGGKLWLLQSRVAKRSPEAAVRLAVAFEREGMIDRDAALDRVAPEQAAALLREHVDPVARAGAQLLAEGRPACPGTAKGTVVTDADEAERRASDGESIVLARPTTDPDDVHAMAAVNAILTELGGATSHAAVVSRELGVPCVVGCGQGVLMALEGQEVTVDAGAGEVLAGVLAVASATEADEPDVAQLRAWARAELPDPGDAPLPELLIRRSDAMTSQG